MERRYYVIDVFASAAFSGNPAAVVLDARGMDDAQMQAVAAEFNLSETTFILAPSDPPGLQNVNPGDTLDLAVRFRWFTPTTEVAMCGHATVAGVHALVESGRLLVREEAQSAAVRIETRSGTLTASVERIPGNETGWMIWLDLIDPILEPQPLVKAELASVLGLSVDAFQSSPPVVRTQDCDVLVFVRDVATLNDATPDFAMLTELLNRNRLRGLCLATVNTLTPSINVQSRFFAPTVGVDEDPVTGSVHGPLVVQLVKQGLVPVHDDGIAALTCVQGKPGSRAGLLYALVQRKEDDVHAVRIGGRAVTTMRGTLIP
jgi:PhzF family phenazine biosynthesis protein